MPSMSNEKLSWELASRLVARHPLDLRLIRAFPGGGQYDVLWVLGEGQRPDIPMNRAGGTIQVHATADGGPAGWQPADWSTYERSDRERFLLELERAAGLPAPRAARAASCESLTYQVIAALVARGDAERPIEAHLGYVDSSGPFGGGEDAAIHTFGFSSELLAAGPHDRHGEPGYRFWIVERAGEPIVAFEQSTAEARICGSEAAVDLTLLAKVHGGATLGGGDPTVAASIVDMLMILVDAPAKPEPGGSARAGSPPSPPSTSQSSVARQAWILEAGDGPEEVLAFEVDEPIGPDGRWSIFVEGPRSSRAIELAEEPMVVSTSSGVQRVRARTVEGAPLRIRPVMPHDTLRVTGLDHLALPTELLARIVRAKVEHTPDHVRILGDDPLIRLELVVSRSQAEVVGLVCEFSSASSQGWSRDGGLWVREQLVLRDAGPAAEGGDLDDDDDVAPEDPLEDLDFVTTPPELAGFVEAVFDSGLPIGAEDVAFITAPSEEHVGFADLPPLIDRLIEGIAGCRLMIGSWCRPDEASIVLEGLRAFESLLRTRTYSAGKPVPWEATRGELLGAIGRCLLLLPDPDLVRRYAFERYQVVDENVMDYPSGLAYLIEHDFDDEH
jgi:hypothetical protein